MKTKTIFIGIILTLFLPTCLHAKGMIMSFLPSGTTTSSWSYRKPITIDYTKVGTSSSSYENFPLLVSVGTNTDFTTKAQKDGDDFVFTKADGITKLSHEIEYFDGTTTGQLIAWVKLPVISGTVNTTIYINYGNSTITNQQEVTAVWDANYKGVWHQDETFGTVYDSTPNTYNATPVGVTLNVTGKIDGGDSFDGNDTLKTSNNIFTRSVFAEGGTFEVWSKPTTLQATQFISIEGYYAIAIDGLGYLRCIVDGATWYTSSTLINTTNFHHIALSFTTEAVTWNTTSRIYYDGQLVYGPVATGVLSAGIDTADSAVALGSHPAGSEPLIGFLDECRISNISRSAGWILTSYNNQNSPSTFYTIGVEEPSQYN